MTVYTFQQMFYSRLYSYTLYTQDSCFTKTVQYKQHAYSLILETSCKDKSTTPWAKDMYYVGVNCVSFNCTDIKTNKCSYFGPPLSTKGTEPSCRVIETADD